MALNRLKNVGVRLIEASITYLESADANALSISA